MTRYNNNRFTPGNKSNLRLFMNNAFIKQYYHKVDNINNSDNITDKPICGCIQQRISLFKQGWNDSSQTDNRRISQALAGNLGGKTTYGNLNTPVTINYLGGWEGQPGGLQRPPRNTF